MSRTATMVWMSTGSAIPAGDAAIRVWPTIIRVAGATRSYARGRVLATEVIPVVAWGAIAARNATVLSWLTIEGVAGAGGMSTRSSGDEGNDWRPCGNRAIESIITEWRFQPWAKYHPKGLEAAVFFEVSIDPKGLQTQRVSKVSSCVQIQIETKGHADTS